MVVPSAGSVVLVPFPFSDLSQSKLGPAVVLADENRDRPDVWVCPGISDFQEGSLRVASYARPGKLFTASQELLVSEVGVLNDKAFDHVLGAVVGVLRPSAK